MNLNKSFDMKSRTVQLALIASALVVAMDATAQVTLTFNGVSPEQTISIASTGAISFGQTGALVGIYNQTIDGVPTPSFCIDVFRDTFTGQTLSNYSYADLSLSPLPPAGPMGASGAVDIEKLWAAYYPTATVNSLYAAALQVAIWETVANSVGTYTLTFSNNDPVTTEASLMLASLSSLTVQANLIGLNSPDGQNFVVPNPVPEPTAASCFLLGLGALFCSQRFIRNRRSN